MKRLFFAAAILWAGVANAQVTLTGDVRNASGQGISIAPGATFVQSCNDGAGGIVGQDSCGFPVTGNFTISLTNYALESGGNLATMVARLTSLVNALGTPIPAQVSHGINIGAVEGAAASGATAAGNPVLMGCRAATSAPTAVTDGQVVIPECGVEGRVVIKPYAIKDLDLRGYASTTANTATTIITAGAGGIKTYVTGLQCYNTSATTVTVLLSDSAASTFIVPAGGGTNVTFPTPLVTAAATAFAFTSSLAETTVGCAAQGYSGT